jgi:hypothetical protein
LTGPVALATLDFKVAGMAPAGGKAQAPLPKI